ncbi:MAG: ribosome recycling factor, partial [Parcubacteria group bacterium GW2011_GWA2_38_13]
HVRDEIKEKIVLAEKDKEITEDEKYAFLEELDNTTKEYNNTIKQLGEEKEKELMTI